MASAALERMASKALCKEGAFAKYSNEKNVSHVDI